MHHVECLVKPLNAVDRTFCDAIKQISLNSNDDHGMIGLESLLDFDLIQLDAFFERLGEKPFRSKQLMRWIYKRGVFDFNAMTDFSQRLRDKLIETAKIELPKIEQNQLSSDGTRKLLLRLADGFQVETVLIPEAERVTQCVSTQCGCAMGCAFCRTGMGGLSRNLTAGEIVGQILLGASLIQNDLNDGEGRLTNIVFMGMGEPLHNLENTLASVRIITSDHGPNITKRRITISTCGLLDAMKRLPAELLPSLAISLNATTDEVRSRIMPVNKRWPLEELLSTLKNLPLPQRGKYTIEYVLLDGVNDSLDDARRLVRLLSGIRCKINLIAYNPFEGSPFAGPKPERAREFQTYLMNKDFTAVLRKSRGADILAACGQLKSPGESTRN